MIFATKSGKSFDSDTDLTGPERHILQKLIMWQHMASSIDQFREKKEEAMLKGWNNSGPVGESPALKAITADMEENVARRVSGVQEP
jgi:hypothetical protein